MAFSAAELHVLRRLLAHALQSSPAPLTAAEVQDCLCLAQSVDDAVQEAGRLRAFLLEDLARYRGALPGSLSGYLDVLREALTAGYEPAPDDLAALRALRANPAVASLLERSQTVAERSVQPAAVDRPRAPGPAAGPGRRQGGAVAPGAAAPAQSPGTAAPRSAGSDSRRGVPAAPQTRAAPVGRAGRGVASLWSWTTSPRSCPLRHGRVLHRSRRDDREEPGRLQQGQGRRGGRRRAGPGRSHPAAEVTPGTTGVRHTGRTPDFVARGPANSRAIPHNPHYRAVVPRPLGELEDAVMTRVWQWNRPVTVREVLEDLQQERSIAYTTVMTVMDNLHQKGWVRREAEGRAYRYTAVSTRAAYSAALMNEAWSTSDSPAAALVAFFGMMSAEQREALRDAVRVVQHDDESGADAVAGAPAAAPAAPVEAPAEVPVPEEAEGDSAERPREPGR